MTYSWGMAEYLTEMIEQLREAQVLDDTWADAAQRAVGYGKGAYTVYYSNDSLGFTRISVFRTDLYVPLLSVVVESKTSLPVTVWITSEDPAAGAGYLQPPVRVDRVQRPGRPGRLGRAAATDWAASALYSARGGVMMSGGTGAMLENLGGGTFLCMHLGAREF